MALPREPAELIHRFRRPCESEATQAGFCARRPAFQSTYRRRQELRALPIAHARATMLEWKVESFVLVDSRQTTERAAGNACKKLLAAANQASITSADRCLDRIRPPSHQRAGHFIDARAASVAPRRSANRRAAPANPPVHRHVLAGRSQCISQRLSWSGETLNGRLFDHVQLAQQVLLRRSASPIFFCAPQCAFDRAHRARGVNRRTAKPDAVAGLVRHAHRRTGNAPLFTKAMMCSPFSTSICRLGSRGRATQSVCTTTLARCCDG